MILSRIHIDGFGAWCDRTWDDLSTGLNVFHGPNEAGKTTLMSFVRAVLFGFERRDHLRRYDPVHGGQHGGWLDLQTGDRIVRVERTAGRHVRGQVRVLDGDAVGGEAALEQMLGGTTRTLYHNVFAFGLEELEHFHTLQEDDVAAHISGAGMGVGARRWSQVWKDLETRRDQIFLPRGQNTSINRALRELEAVREELDRAAGEPEAYLESIEARKRIEEEVRELERLTGELGARLEQYRRVREAEPHRERRRALEAELAGLETVERFPEAGAERLRLLLEQRRQLEGEMTAQHADVERMRAERLELASGCPLEDLLHRDRAAGELRRLLPLREEAAAQAAAALELRSQARRARDEAARRREVLASPSAAAVGATLAVVALSVYGLYVATGERLVLALLVLPPLFLAWYARRRRRARRAAQEVRGLEGRLEAAEAGLGSAEAEVRRRMLEIQGWAGRTGFSVEDLARDEARLRELKTMAERIRSLDEAIAAEERQRERIRRRFEENEAAIRSLLAEGEAPSEDEFFRRAQVHRRRAGLRAELDRTPAGVVAPEPGVEPLDPDGQPAAAARFEAARQRLDEVRNEAGRLDERIATLGRSEQRSRARLRQESILASIEEAAEKWAVLTLCRALLEDTRKVYESERQPEVLRHASDFLERMTAGRWRRVIAPLNSVELSLESAQGGRSSPARLSRGTAEQLYLAMRLALIREYARHVEPLPVIFDDIFVNFDPVRTARSLEGIRELCRTHQVLLFTCHPHLVGIVEEIVPEARIYPLQ